MSKIPKGLSGRVVARALERAGFYRRRQKGSHLVMRRDKPFSQVVVPMHKSLDTGTLNAILDGAGISTQDFLTLLKRRR